MLGAFLFLAAKNLLSPGVYNRNVLREFLILNMIRESLSDFNSFLMLTVSFDVIRWLVYVFCGQVFCPLSLLFDFLFMVFRDIDCRRFFGCPYRINSFRNQHILNPLTLFRRSTKITIIFFPVFLFVYNLCAILRRPIRVCIIIPTLFLRA